LLLSEALIEAAPGATRALVRDGDAILEAHFERDDALRPGHRSPARLTTILVKGVRGIATLPCGAEMLLSPLPDATEGAAIGIEITRAALPEAARPRLPRARPLAEIPPSIAGPDLAARLKAAGHHVLPVRGPEDRLEAAGWSEMIEQARTGHVAFAGGLLTITPTPAMTTIDIDGDLPPEALAHAAVVPLAQAIRRLDLQGSTAVDFPSLQGAARKTLDMALATALKAHLAGAFEATAVNGFGLVQIIRPRTRPSLMEAVRAQGFDALELLRRAARHGHGPATLHAPPAMIGWLQGHADLLESAAHSRGGTLTLRAEPRLATSAAYVS
jgi:hypothetical protein